VGLTSTTVANIKTTTGGTSAQFRHFFVEAVSWSACSGCVPELEVGPDFFEFRAIA